ncbi:PhzF family phenazine biosynthesis protein [Chitinimonas koreensis]|uniref:PhzF family phenazine biosynthesis protein n=1 Tax=Chitinimonas koreensis TaxID=356302 RepID=UPI0004246BD5|nr:PhzF family phenazine biosynthesis protein [Chitinimonas koreensis]QNM96159.1 PhzF family phenazine biosynthesis protein [Chitinimonas koreensis]
MPLIRYRLLNVFAEETFGGNPLAVIEDGSMLSDAEMQLVARQFNLSETTFLLPSEEAAARVRIFTPGYEMPFAGHPTLGSAQVVRDLLEAGDRFKLEMQAGLIPVAADGDRWTLAANPPEHRPMEAAPAELAAMLGLPAEAIAGQPLWVSCGNEQAMIPLASVEQVHACRPDPALLKRYAVNHTGKPKAYVFARTDEGFEARFFWTPDAGLGEDPGTGSAAANLGGWWLATQAEKPLDAVIRQGTAMGRPNVLSLRVDGSGIRVGGRVVELGRGVLRW